MKLGVYICDRGQQPTRLRELDSHDKDTYIIGRPTETHSPEIALHHGKISKRHLILIHEDPGYWTASSLGKNGSILIRNGFRRSMSQGDAVPIMDDDCIEVYGPNYAVTFKTDFESTITENLDTNTIAEDEDEGDEGEDEDSDRSSKGWALLADIYSKAGPLEKILIAQVVMVVAIAALYFAIN